MKGQIILLFLTFGLLVQCKNSGKTKTKTEQIFAENEYDFGGNIKFNFFSDSTYTFTVIEKSPNYEKIEKFNGFCFKKNDTIYFKPFEFKFNESEKAVLKNGFIEFVDGENPLKIEIKNSVFKTKTNLDFKNYNDYAVFTFDEKFYSSTYYNYKPNANKASDITQAELKEIDKILRKCFSENCLKLKSLKDYVKQCIIVTNSHQEKEAWISCYCKSAHVEKEYKYSIIRMNDGGKCNVNLKINLTKKSYSELNIAGKG